MAVTPPEPPHWLRLQDVRVDLRKLFLKLGAAATKAGVAASTGTWAAGAGAIITDLFGAAEAVSRDTPPEALAWRLLRRSLTRALAELGRVDKADRGHRGRIHHRCGGGWCPGGRSGSHRRYSPGDGRCPDGMGGGWWP